MFSTATIQYPSFQLDTWVTLPAIYLVGSCSGLSPLPSCLLPYLASTSSSSPSTADSSAPLSHLPRYLD
ncbi:hypothetical protein WAI453_013331 [Rhynchosporium graminicola]